MQTLRHRHHNHINRYNQHLPEFYVSLKKFFLIYFLFIFVMPLNMRFILLNFDMHSTILLAIGTGVEQIPQTCASSLMEIL